MSKSYLLLWVACILMLAVNSGCQREDASLPQRSTGTVQVELSATELAARPALYGYSAEAWLTDCGGNSDSGYCTARLKLPLATEPAWEYAYSPAEFSRQAVNGIVHYQGRLFLTAYSSQLVALDAQSGQVLFNQDVYEHDSSDTIEQLRGIYGHPQGLLLGQDNLGRYYVWDLLTAGLPRLWLGPRIDNRAPFITDGELMLTSWGDQLYALNTLTGKPVWQYPSASQPGGVVLSRSGIEVWWNDEGRLYALNAADGSLRWSILTPDLIERAIIDDEKGLVYIAYGSEYVECRELATGVTRWQYSWFNLVGTEERRARFDTAREMLGDFADRVNWTGVSNRLATINLNQEQVYLGLWSGHVIALDATGHERWQAQVQAPVAQAVAFANGVLVGAIYARPRALLDQRSVYCLADPAWPYLASQRQAQAEPEAEDQTPPAEDQGDADPSRFSSGSTQEVFYRLAVLDPATGTELDAFEPARMPIGALTPAAGMLVFAAAPWRIVGIGPEPEGEKMKVLAYPWLDWEGR